MDEGRTTGLVYHSFSKASDTVSRNILKQAEKMQVRKVDSKVDWKLAEQSDPESWDQWHKIHVEASHYCYPQVEVPGPVLFNIFISDLDTGIVCIHSKFTDNTKLGGEDVGPCSCAPIQMDINRWENWIDRNLTKFSEGKWKVLHLGKNYPMCQYMLRAKELISNSTDWDLRVLIDNKLIMSSNAASQWKRSTVSWPALTKT